MNKVKPKLDKYDWYYYTIYIMYLSIFGFKLYFNQFWSILKNCFFCTDKLFYSYQLIWIFADSKMIKIYQLPILNHYEQLKFQIILNNYICELAFHTSFSQ